MPLITAELPRKGYALAARTGTGDVVIYFGSGRRTARIPQATPPERDQSELESPHFDYDEVERGLVVDVLDAKTNARMWQGSSSAEVAPDRVDAALLERLVPRSWPRSRPRRGCARDEGEARERE